MEALTTCTSFIAALMAIAYPILLQVITQLDNKYNSLEIISLFKSVKEKKLFSIFLILSLFFIFLWILDLPPLISFLAHSAKYGTIIFTACSIVFFFLLINKVLLFHIPASLVNYIFQHHSKELRNNRYSYVIAISDVLNTSIKNDNFPLVELIWRRTSALFNEHRHKTLNDKQMNFPGEYYSLISRTVGALINSNSRQLNFVEDSTVGANWILGDAQHSWMSNNTYDTIWRNLRFVLERNRADLLLSYWSQAYNYSRNILIPAINKNASQENLKAQEHFINFHAALGGLLLFHKQNEILNTFFTYKKSDPPEFPLLPKTMDDIFRTYLDFQDPFNGRYPFINIEFRFSDFGGFEKDIQVRQWMCKYVVLLFIRQFTLTPNLNNLNPCQLPKLPSNRLLIDQWRKSIPEFKEICLIFLQNTELLKDLGLSNIDIQRITDFFTQLEKKLQALVN